MNLLKTITSVAKKVIDIHQKKQTLRVLMELSDAQLEDIGISRHDLQSGIKAYPWRGVTEQPTQSAKSAKVLHFQRPTSSAPVMESESATGAANAQRAA